jgi:hypothetical protein
VLAMTIPRMLNEPSVAPTGIADNPILAVKIPPGNAKRRAPVDQQFCR